jgi:putative polyhydroxyalkanoate system protein
MADIELTRSHSLGLDGGREAVERVAQQLEADIGVDYEWDDNTLHFEGDAADGTIDVANDTVDVLINLSAFLRPMQGQIETEAERYLDEHLQS